MRYQAALHSDRGGRTGLDRRLAQGLYIQPVLPVQGIAGRYITDMALRPACYYFRAMSRTLTISDELAAALEAKRQQADMPSIDVAAEMLLADALAADSENLDDLGLSVEGLRAFIAEGLASGPAEPWDPDADFDEIRRRFAASKTK